MLKVIIKIYCSCVNTCFSSIWSLVFEHVKISGGSRIWPWRGWWSLKALTVELKLFVVYVWVIHMYMYLNMFLNQSRAKRAKKRKFSVWGIIIIDPPLGGAPLNSQVNKWLFLAAFAISPCLSPLISTQFEHHRSGTNDAIKHYHAVLPLCIRANLTTTTWKHNGAKTWLYLQHRISSLFLNVSPWTISIIIFRSDVII